MSRLGAKAKSRIYSNLEKYARSGMGMEKACESLLGQPGIPSAERKIYLGMLDGIRHGESIGSSMARGGMSVSDLELGVVSASERGGMLEKGFHHLGEYFRRMEITRRRILKGMAYPIVLIHLALPICVFATTAINSFSFDSATSFAETFKNAAAQAGWWLLAVYLIAIIFVVGVIWLHSLSKKSALVDRFFNFLPIVGKARRYVALERFCRVFEIFLVAGLKMSDSLAGAGKATGSGLLDQASQQGAKIVAQGNKLAGAIYARPDAFPNDLARGIAAAEEAGFMDKELGQWGNFYGEAAGEALDSVARWAPKLFYWMILGFVAFLIIRAAMAYQGLLNRLLDFEF